MKKLKLLIISVLLFTGGGNFLLAGTSPWCDTKVGHFGKADFGDAMSHVLVTITQGSSANTLKVSFKPASDNPKKLTYIWVNWIGKEAKDAGKSDGSGNYDELSVEFTYSAGTKTANIEFQWAHNGWAGRWCMGDGVSDGCKSITVNLDDTCGAEPEPTPSITASTDNIKFLSSEPTPRTKTFTVTGSNLTDKISIVSNSSNFSVSPLEIAANATFPVTVTVTCNATTDETAKLTISSTGAASQYVDLSYYTPKEIVFTSSCKIQGTGIFLYFNGYQEGTYAHNKDKYEVSINSSKGAKTIRVENPAGGYLYCVMSGIAPEDTEINTITLKYKDNGDTGTITFKGTQVLNPSMSVSPTEWICMAQGATKDFTVTAEALKQDVSITSSSDHFTVSKSSISKDATFPQSFTVTCATFVADENATITLTSGSIEQNITITTQNPEPTMSVTPTALALNGKTKSGVITLSAQYLTSDVTVASSNSDITVDKSSITKDEANAGDVDITVTSNATEDATATITIESGALSKEVNITYTAPKELVITNATLDAASAHVAFEGYGSTYSKTDKSKYTITVSSESPASVGLNYFNLETDIFLALTAAPGDYKTTINIVYENGDYGVVKFKDSKWQQGALLDVTPASIKFASSSIGKFIVDAEDLTDDITVSVPAGFNGATSISRSETFPYEYTVSSSSGETVTGTFTFSTPGASGTISKSVTAKSIVSSTCEGYYDSFQGTPSQDCSFMYSYSQTPDGQLNIEFTFMNSVSGINPQIYFIDKNVFKNMVSKGGNKYSYTTVEGDYDGTTSVAFKGYFPYSGGLAQTNDITYTFGSCGTISVKIGDMGYTSFADAYAAANAGDEIILLANLDENAVISKFVKINGGGYGLNDVTIDLTGKLEITGATNFNTLIIKSQPNVGAGQVFTSGAGSATASEVYAEREFRDSFQQLWYSLALPFACDAASGLYNTNGIQITKGVWFNEYNSQKRADTGLSSGNWDYVTSLSKGTAYMIYMNEGINTVRFKAANPNDIFTQTASIPYYEYNGSADAEHHGWNFMAQPMSSNAWAGVTKGDWGYIQVLRNGGATASDGSTSGQYTTESVAGTVNIAPYTAFMFQASADGTMNFNASNGEAVIKSAEYEEPSYFKVTLSDANGNTDATFVSASEDASATEYEIGKDLAKCGSSSAFVQITTTDLGLELTVNQAKAYNGEATIPLLLNCPAAGIYTVSVAEMSEIGDIYLLRNGAVVCDLGFEGYTFNVSEKQLNKDYSLLIKLNGGVYTDADGVVENSIYAKDRVIYVNGIYATEITNIAGQSVSNPVPEKGVYVVEDVKISVE